MEEKILKPSFFIVGAPKCGTTSLFDYLSQHPEIKMSKEKEPNFFNTDLIGSKKCGSSMDVYLSNFISNDKAKISGEGTTWYLFSEEAARNIYEFNPDSKIIIMLRNPVKMLFSLHNHYMYHGNIETIKDFKKAIKAEADRIDGRNMPKHSTRPYGVFYSKIVDYAPQIERYYDLFGNKNVKVIIFEDFISKTCEIYKEVLEFLAVDSGFIPVLVKQNVNRKVKSVFLYRIIRFVKHNSFLAFLTRKMKLGFGFTRRIRDFNTTEGKMNEFDSAFENELKEKLTPQVERTESLLNIRIPQWH